MVKTMVRSERRSRIVLIACTVNSAIALLFVLSILIFRPNVAWDEMMPILGIQFVLALGLAMLIRLRQRRRRALGRAITTIREATEMGLENVRSEMRDARVLLLSACIAVPMFAVSVNQLISSGKMDSKAALSFGILLAGVIAVNAVIIWRRHRRVLVPSRMRMEQILASLEESAA